MLKWIGRKYMEMQEVREENRKNGEMGFTLIELLVVVIIIGILAAIAIPVFLNQRAKAADSRAQANVREAASAVQIYFTEEGTMPGTDVGELNGYGFQQTTPAVTMTSSGSGSAATFCVASVTDGGTVTSYKMSNTDASPVSGAC